MLYVPGLAEDEQAHAQYHDRAMNGLGAPADLNLPVIWNGDALRLVLMQHRRAETRQRAFAAQVCLMARRSVGRDFTWFGYDGGPQGKHDPTIYLLLDELTWRAIGMVTMLQRPHARPLHLVDWTPGPHLRRRHPTVEMIWVAKAQQRRGMARTMVQAVAESMGLELEHLAWATPFSAAGERLVRSLYVGSCLVYP